VKLILLFAIPVFLGNLFQIGYSLVDTKIVGRILGETALAAVGSVSILYTLLTGFFNGLSLGFSVLTAQYYGAKRNDDLKETVHTSMLLSLYCGLLLTVVGLVGAPMLLELMKAPPEVLDLAVLYLRIYFLGMASMMVYNFGSSILRAVGDTKRPLYYLLGAGIVNVLLNLFFVIVCHLGVAGVALATVISQTISAFLVVRCLIKEQGGIHLELKELAISREKLGKIMQIGLPAGFQGTVFSLSNVVIQSAVNSFGNIAVAGNSAAANIEGFVYMAMNAFHQATISFTSQNYGAREYRRIYRILFAGELCVVATGLLLGNLAVFFGDVLLGIYSPSAEVIAAGMVRLKVICTLYALCGVMDVLVGALRGIGYSIIPMVVSLVGACGLRLLWIATVFRIPEYHSLFTVYLSYPITWTITLTVHAVTFALAARKVLRTEGAPVLKDSKRAEKS